MHERALMALHERVLYWEGNHEQHWTPCPRCVLLIFSKSPEIITWAFIITQFISPRLLYLITSKSPAAAACPSSSIDRGLINKLIAKNPCYDLLIIQILVKERSPEKTDEPATTAKNIANTTVETADSDCNI